ncbi:hypothetical protein CC1G_15783 [Coprinopsis cinerea okayama7|uniref:Uncharacterized protein n=1 Tax=Coprinopsis cinerea (strain Okayama-7 / 130 / ATCC MYA-4618 / FGSC 9003) TaxID=240176 RepID=D6RQY6_COPC7|nr:hypothetical protein CC1G_15783 [Coprinopsis cinerea okayama7\|eukprot:XP_002910063.1 hypothetical protein CC1G_15783 [Coprinopsis cinerea okayama7\
MSQAHAPHRSLALWALGADGDVIAAGYEKDCGYEKPGIPAPRKITRDNFNDHLGDETFYRAYLDFFSEILVQKGINATVEEFLFSPEANIGRNKNIPQEKQPRMLARFFSGVVHPLIHTGYGVEFGLPGLVAEGLAQTAVHAPGASALVPPELFESSTFSALSGMAESAGRALQGALGSTVNNLDNAFDSVLQKTLHLGDASRRQAPEAGARTEGSQLNIEDRVAVHDVHALDILGWVSEDLRFAPPPKQEEKNSFDRTIGKHAGPLLKFANMWKLDVNKLGTDPQYLESKIEELAWTVTTMYGVGGWTGRGTNKDGTDALFNADFFLMHLVTSSLFVPSICAAILPVARGRFLHTYLAVALAMYVFRGAPPLDLVGFSKLKVMGPSGPQPHPSKDTLPSPTSPKAINADPWLSLLQTSIVHPDEHLTKTQRSLSTWASHFGTRKFTCSSTSKLAPAGGGSENHGEVAAGLGMGWGVDTTKGKVDTNSDSEAIPLEWSGAECLDGNIFIRTAELTAKRMGRVREGEETGEFWDFKGFYQWDTNPSTERKAHL